MQNITPPQHGQQIDNNPVAANQPAVRNANNPFPTEEIDFARPQNDHQAHLLADRNSRVMHTWQDIIEREDMNAFRALLEQYKSRFEKEFIAGEEGSRRIEYNYNFKEKILETLVNNSKIDMLKVFAEHYDGICAIPTYRHRYLIDPFSNPISKNPNLDEIIFILGSHNLLHHKIINVVLDDLCNLDTRETKNIQRIKLLLFFDSASHTKSMIRLYDTITKKINATMQEPNSEEKTEKLAYLNAIKNIFDEVDKLDKQGIPRKQMEVLQSSTAKKINKR